VGRQRQIVVENHVLSKRLRLTADDAIEYGFLSVSVAAGRRRPMESLSELRPVPLQERAIFNLMFFLEHYVPGNERVKAIKEGSRLRAAEHVQRGGAGKVVTVDRVRNISPVDFRERYLAKGLPVIIENGAADWPLAKRWSFDNFTERFGESTIRLTQRIGLSDDDWIDEHEYTEEVVFGEFLKQVRAGGRKYMRFAPLLEQFPELLDDFDRDFFREMTGHAWGLTYQLFIGGQGSYTPLHNAITPFFFANVCGIKRWALISCRYLPIINPSPGLGYNHSDARVGGPNDDRYAGFDSIDRMEAVLQPGDVLFNPPWMWHSVENDSPTIGVRCGFIYPRGMLAASLTLTLTRLFAARDPSLLEALRHALSNNGLRLRDVLSFSPKLLETMTTRLYTKPVKPRYSARTQRSPGVPAWPDGLPTPEVSTSSSRLDGPRKLGKATG
jgi:hypothetical protein